MTKAPPLVSIHDALERSVIAGASPFPVEVTLDAPADAGHYLVRADRTQLELALRSLAVFACQTLGGHPGSIEVLMETVLVEDVVLGDGPPAVGSGMPPRAHVHLRIAGGERGESVLAPLESTQPSGLPTVRRLGLVEVRDVLAGFDGTLTVGRTPARMTCFDVWLPAVHIVPESLAARAGARRPHVLYVDDYLPIRQLVGQSLSDVGLKATCHGDPTAALASLLRDPAAFDLALLDFHMPGSNGIELGAEFRRARPDLRLVLLTTHVDPATESRARQAGFAAVLSKASNLHDLVGEVARQARQEIPEPA